MSTQKNKIVALWPVVCEACNRIYYVQDKNRKICHYCSKPALQLRPKLA